MNISKLTIPFNRFWSSGATGTAHVVDPGEDLTTDGYRAVIPAYEHFNFLFRWFSKGLSYLNLHGVAEWDAVTEYPVNAFSKGSDAVMYKAVLEQANNDPITDDGTNWVAVTGTGGVEEPTDQFRFVDLANNELTTFTMPSDAKGMHIRWIDETPLAGRGGVVGTRQYPTVFRWNLASGTIDTMSRVHLIDTNVTYENLYMALNGDNVSFLHISADADNLMTFEVLAWIY